MTQSASVQHLLLGASAPLEALREEIAAAARSDAKVLLTGETGVGKEVVARAIHAQSGRTQGPFVAVNCAGVPDTLLESEFFGHARGSFTDAIRDSPGMLRLAHGGTIFLDEVGEMSLRLQALLLRFLETGEIQTIGGSAAGLRTHADVRVITATNRDLTEAITERTFREDLYYRLNVLQIGVPPLRDRSSDVEILLDHYLSMFAAQHRTPTPQLSPAALRTLSAYPWPGNVRELRNVAERLVLRAHGSTIEPSQLPADIAHTPVVEQAPAQSAHGTPRIEALLDRIFVGRESFWTTIYPAFMSRNLTREDLRFAVRAGLERTKGSYRLLVELFNMPADDYKRFLAFLKQHECHLPFRRFRHGALLASMAVASTLPSAPLKAGDRRRMN